MGLQLITEETTDGRREPRCSTLGPIGDRDGSQQPKTLRHVRHIDRSHSLRWASPRSQCAYLCRSRTPEPTLRPDRWSLSVCYLKAEFRGA